MNVHVQIAGAYIPIKAQSTKTTAALQERLFDLHVFNQYFLCVVFLWILPLSSVDFTSIFGQSEHVCAYNTGKQGNNSLFLIVCFTSYIVFSIAVLPRSPGVVYYHLLLRRETRIPGVAPFSFRIGIWDLFVHRGQKSYTPTAFGKLWTTPGVRCMKHASS